MIGVTGANGLLGQLIISKLKKSGHDVVGIIRPDHPSPALDALNIPYRYANITDPLLTEEALQGIDQLIHSAALVSWDPREKKKIYTVNVEGTKNIVNACLATNVKKLVHISSIATISGHKDKDTLDENDQWGDFERKSIYAESKYLAELEVFRGQEEGLKTLIVNPSVILSPGRWDRGSAKIFQYVWNEYPYYIDGELNYVDGRDVAEIIVRLLFMELQGERFIINAGKTSYKALLEGIADHFNQARPHIRIPRQWITLVAWADVLLSRVLGKKQMISPHLASLNGNSHLYSNQKIKKTMDYEFKTLENSLSWCCKTLIDDLKLKK